MKDLIDQVLYLVSSANDLISHEMTDETYCAVTDKLCQASRTLRQLRDEASND
jgi:hypothetical protein